MVGLNWVSLIRISSDWIEKFLLKHDNLIQGKVVTRAYSIKFAGQEEHMQALIEFMADKIKEFVFSKAEIEEFKKQDIDPWRKSAKYLGPVDPTKEGKYGELLLFLLVEAVLKAPMVAHKIKSLGDPNDQVKGSDGVFFGPYRGKDSLLFGEAKVYQDRNQAINKALQSVDKFHNASSAYSEIEAELQIVKETITNDLSPEQAEFLSNVLDTQSKEYQNVNKVHPILIVYDDQQISNIENVCQDNTQGEEMVCATFGALAKEILPKIQEKIDTKWKTLQKVYLDFFFIPVSSVDRFRNSMFKAIHNMGYR